MTEVIAIAALALLFVVFGMLFGVSATILAPLGNAVKRFRQRLVR